MLGTVASGNAVAGDVGVPQPRRPHYKDLAPRDYVSRCMTMEIREGRDAALKRLEHVESLLKAQGGSENKQLVATKRANRVLMKRVENVNMLRKKEKAGFTQATTELKRESEKLQKAIKKAAAPQKENNPQAVLKARRKSKALEEARKYSFAGRPEPSQWYPRG